MELAPTLALPANGERHAEFTMHGNIVTTKRRFILFLRQSIFYAEDTLAKKQTSLFTKDRATAERLPHA